MKTKEQIDQAGADHLTRSGLVNYLTKTGYLIGFSAGAEWRDQDDWVYFSEKEPEKPDEYLVTDGESVSVMFFTGEGWTIDGNFLLSDGESEISVPLPAFKVGEHLTIIAWQPLPKPPKIKTNEQAPTESAS